jgi:hypothetical protein
MTPAIGRAVVAKAVATQLTPNRAEALGAELVEPGGWCCPAGVGIRGPGGNGFLNGSGVGGLAFGGRLATGCGVQGTAVIHGRNLFCDVFCDVFCIVQSSRSQG